MGNNNDKEEDVWMAPGFINQFYKESFFVNLFLVHGEGWKQICLFGKYLIIGKDTCMRWTWKERCG